MQILNVMWGIKSGPQESHCLDFTELTARAKDKHIVFVTQEDLLSEPEKIKY